MRFSDFPARITASDFINSIGALRSSGSTVTFNRDVWQRYHRLPFHIFKRPHSISGECPAFDALGVDLACLGLGVTVDRHDLVL